MIAEQATGYPGYDAIIGRENAAIGEILKQNGYATSWFGKNHNTPGYEYSLSGPFDQWPSGMGFQYFYGFMGGETDQWRPWLFRDHTQIFPWVGNPGYNLTTAMADDAINHIKGLNAAAPDQPFLSITPPAARMHRISRRRNGSRRSATCTCSTRAGTNCASGFSPIRSGSA